ncbi:MAG: histidine phosphatase family protein [Patescibacteria group bacterium]|jgi:broad specificity phosphatase PhoE
MRKLGKIYLIRHGQDEDNARGILNGHRNKPLTKLGVRQAKAAAEKLKNKKIEVVISSPLRRAEQTADIISKLLGIKKVYLEADLREREFGILTGKLVKEIPLHADAYLRINKSVYFTKGKGVESFAATLKRAKNILKNIRKAYIGKNLLIVSHGDLCCMMLASERQISWKKGLEKWDGIKNAQIINL